jgi:hypothetical protein
MPLMKKKTISLIVIFFIICNAEVKFERKNKDVDYFEASSCISKSASYHLSGWCKCDFMKVFVGDKCLSKNQISGK